MAMNRSDPMPKSRISFGDCLGAIGYFAAIGAAIFFYAFLDTDDAFAHAGALRAAGPEIALIGPAAALAGFGAMLSLIFALGIFFRLLSETAVLFLFRDEDEGRE
jgi:hypothetical protein